MVKLTGLKKVTKEGKEINMIMRVASFVLLAAVTVFAGVNIIARSRLLRRWSGLDAPGTLPLNL